MVAANPEMNDLKLPRVLVARPILRPGTKRTRGPIPDQGESEEQQRNGAEKVRHDDQGFHRVCETPFQNRNI